MNPLVLWAAALAFLLVQSGGASPNSPLASKGDNDAAIGGDTALLAEPLHFRPEISDSYANRRLMAGGTPVKILERDGNKYRVKPVGMHPRWVERISLTEKVSQPQAPKITPDEIRARALQRQRDAAIERAERDRENAARPRELKKPSRLASPEEWEAYRAKLVMQAIERGEATVADLPEDYGGRPTGTSRRAIAARKAWDRNQAIEMENKLTKAGRITEATALRQMRLQEEANESLEKVAIEVERLRQDFERDRWLRGYY